MARETGNGDAGVKAPVPGKIIIVMMSAVGDAVHVLPVVNALKRANPACTITWILQPGPASLIADHPAVDEIIVFDRKKGFGGFLDLRRKLASRRFDLLLNLQVYLKAGIITLLVEADRKLGFDRSRARDMNWIFTNLKIPRRPVQHVQDQYFEFLEALGVSPTPLQWDLGPTENERGWQRDFVQSVGGEYAAIVVATSKAEKDWFPDRWAAVIDHLQDQYGIKSVLVGGTTEREVQARAAILAAANYKPVDALGSGLRNLVSIVDGAGVVISPDTGPLHIAVALNKPVISLIGYTNPRRTGPYRKFRDLMIDAYADPGENYPPSLENRPDRMQRISIDDVEHKIAIWNAKYRAKSVAK
ncbi:MAG: glycosyltransferase family 9 protein [Gemmatimonadaceae bacterium]|nr:glycosyltransferase family 9 protein [Gemmatimonadaceae bacterium]